MLLQRLVAALVGAQLDRGGSRGLPEVIGGTFETAWNRVFEGQILIPEADLVACLNGAGEDVEIVALVGV